jgi:putative Holliday junction resolvase
MKILGVDVGEKRIGLAISDEMQMIARELGVVPVAEFSSQLKSILEKEDVSKIVVGRPRNLSGDLGPQAARVEEFARKEIEPLGKEVIWEDETLTSTKAEEELKNSGATPEEIKNKLDAVAARIILQSYLGGL